MSVLMLIMLTFKLFFTIGKNHFFVHKVGEQQVQNSDDSGAMEKNNLSKKLLLHPRMKSF